MTGVSIVPDEKAWLAATLERQWQEVAAKHGANVGLLALLDRRGLALAAIYFNIVTATCGAIFFLP
jgi:ACS family tartrate transporter-like MFS transporter